MIKDFDISWSGDGIVYFDGSLYGEFTIKCFNVGDQYSVPIIDKELWPHTPRLSRDGKIMAFTGINDGVTNIYLYDFENEKITRIETEPMIIPGFSEFKPDNEKIAYSAFGNDIPPGIYLYTVNTQQVVKITDAASGDRFPHWSFSGRYIAYTHQKVDDLHKRRWIGVYDMATGKTVYLPKQEDSQCIISKSCWVSGLDELVYLETADSTSRVNIYSIATNTVRLICETDHIREVSFVDPNLLLFISKDRLRLYSMVEKKIVEDILLPEWQYIQFAPDGAVVHNSQKGIYFLTESGSIFEWNLCDSPKHILQSEEDNETPLLERGQISILSYDQRELPIYHYIPKEPNGFRCILAIGGPGGSAEKCDSIIYRFLKEGYELFVPAYRGCTENPDNSGTMGQGDVRDIIEAGNVLKKQYGYKLPTVGYSYGGLLTFLALANSRDTFSFGASLWGVTSLEKMAVSLGKAVTDEMDEKTKRQLLNERSAVIASKRIHCPIAIFHGEKDTMSTTEEVEQIYRNITDNKVPCKLVVYPKGIHGLPNETDDYHRELYACFRQHAMMN